MDCQKRFQKFSSRTRTAFPARGHLERGLFILLLLAAGCGVKDNKIKAHANGVKAHMAASKRHFAAEAETICGDLSSAETSVVPPFGKVCSRGCRCAGESDNGADPRTRYECSAWDTPEWKLLNFMGMYTLDEKVNPVVYFHHQASWRRTEQGCHLDFTVYGDLDEDGVYSTFTTTIETRPDGPVGEWADESLLWE